MVRSVLSAMRVPLIEKCIAFATTDGVLATMSGMVAIKVSKLKRKHFAAAATKCHCGY